MKIRFFFSLILCFFALNLFGQASTDDNIAVFPHKKGDPRVKPRGLGVGFNVVADEIEAWREKPADILAELGEDLDWVEDKKKATAAGGHVVEAVITPGETAELCMIPADASKVTHLKLTGRAMKWGAYGPDDLNLPKFLRTMKNLKVLNLRDLDCEIIYLDRLNNVEKIVLPANCTSTQITGNNKLKELITGPRFEAFGKVIYEKNKKSYQVELEHSFLDLGAMQEFKFPEGVLYIGCFRFGKSTKSVTFPSTLKVIEFFGGRFIVPPHAHMEIPSLEEIHVNSNTPPVVSSFPFKYEHLKNVTLYVPKGSKSAYMKDLKWRNFGAIVEEDVNVEQRPVDEELVIYKPVKAEDVQGKWKFVSSDITNADGTNRRPGANSDLDYMILDGKYWSDFKKDGSKVQNRYQFIDEIIYLGTHKFHIEKADDNELILYVNQKVQNQDFKFIFTFTKMD